MAKSGSKKTRLKSLTSRKLNEKIYDVTLCEFADSVNQNGKGRLRKSKNVLSLVRKIITSDDVDTTPVEDNEEELGSVKVSQLSETVNVLPQNNEENNKYIDYPLKIWLLIAEYIRPEDVKSFSLICRNTLTVVNTPLFWIRLYKRYYRKTEIPKCLSYHCLEVRKCLKQKVVRSLYYFYSPYASSVTNNSIVSIESLIGTLCLHHWVQGFKEKETNEEFRWLYSFKLCYEDFSEHWMQQKSHFHNCSGIHYNPDNKCRLLKRKDMNLCAVVNENLSINICDPLYYHSVTGILTPVICKEYIVIPSVRGMRLRKMDCNSKTTSLTFSSAPLSRVNSELGTVTIHLDHTQKPLILPWWHPDYWDHTKCCNKKKF